ncbi:adenylate cyclase [Hoeflea sp. BAL378]|uniref:CYTH domain-containing protein n=1 Tax=Hoeflea sp. BAL378 TaxID=1547437 RepID=UPI000513C561|nr:CYTH domain-containing protein [Hoeflea sp. BAL378]KGF68468.1 adenylate cyclase [Hoeflea sp. BAL378]
MAREIERKFIVDSDAWRAGVETSRAIVQAYLAIDGDTSVRVRISCDAEARLAVKFGVSDMTRDEFEYPVPLEDARQMVAANPARRIEKTRHILRSGGYLWEVDVFEGRLAGLVIAEVEMGSEDETPALPAWLGREVTGEAAWSNAMLATHGWPEGARP